MSKTELNIGEYVNREEHLIASKLFKTRIKLGIERDELSLMAGIEEADLIKYENAVEPIPASILLLLSTIMGININYFYDNNLILIQDLCSENEEERSVLLS